MCRAQISAAQPGACVFVPWDERKVRCHSTPQTIPAVSRCPATHHLLCRRLSPPAQFPHSAPHSFGPTMEFAADELQALTALVRAGGAAGCAASENATGGSRPPFSPPAQPTDATPIPCLPRSPPHAGGCAHRRRGGLPGGLRQRLQHRHVCRRFVRRQGGERGPQSGRAPWARACGAAVLALCHVDRSFRSEGVRRER